jgi:hypothetical protein
VNSRDVRVSLLGRRIRRANLTRPFDKVRRRSHTPDNH